MLFPSSGYVLFLIKSGQSFFCPLISGRSTTFSMIHFYRREQGKQNRKDLLFIVFHFIHWYNKINFNVCLFVFAPFGKEIYDQQTNRSD